MVDKRGGKTTISVTGQKITVFPDKLGPGRGKKNLGGYILVNTDAREALNELEKFNQRISSALLADPDARAAAIQERLRVNIGLAYNKASTGRMARGIFAKVQKRGSADGKGIETSIVITMFNYREARFLTNIGGQGYFKSYPVGRYQIFAKGAEGYSDPSNPSTGRTTKTSTKRAINFALGQGGVGRLKVPRNTAFFTAGRQQGRGGGESRIINDFMGPAKSTDRKDALFFYPLWVNHPGFQQDVISEVALSEGASFTSEVVETVAVETKQISKQVNTPGGPENKKPGRKVQEAIRLPDTTTVTSKVIPLPGVSIVTLSRGKIRSVPLI